MRKFLLFFVLLCCILFSKAQTPLFQKNSTYQYFFKLTAQEAFEFSQNNQFPFEKFLDITPTFILSDTANYKDNLPTGMYAKIKIKDLQIEANLYIQTELYPNIYNVHNKLMVQIRNKDGVLINNPYLAVNNKIVKYDKTINGYYVKERKLDGKFLQIASNNDTTLFEVERQEQNAKERNENDRPYLLQKWQRFKSKKLGKKIMWLPERIMSIWDRKYQTKRFRKRNNYLNGYFIFNQPKYKLGDTVRWKSFVVNKQGKPIRRKYDLTLS
jgi:alpha-2-macroglobulin